MLISTNNKKLLSNTGFLYLMTVSTQVLNLVTIPYLTRILGPSVYGRIGLALGYMAYVQIILDFGFTLSATQMITENKNNRYQIEKIVSSVTAIKIILSIIIAVIFLMLYKINIFDSTNAFLIMVYLLGYLLNALMPDFFYRGMENMKIIAIRTFIIKVVFTCLIFIFVKDVDDVLFVPLSFLCGSILALLVTLIDINKNYKIRFQVPRKKELKKILVDTFPFFASRFASTFYQALNVIVIGRIYGVAPEVGYYSSSDKIIALVKMGSSPIADSLYPYMLSNKNYKLVKRLLLCIMPIITIGVIIVGIFAEPICIFIFGEEYAEVGNILRLLLPVAWVILPTYIIAFPVMSPLGLVKYANISNIVGMVIQVVGLIVLYLIRCLNVYTICGLTSVTEVSVFLYRLIVVIICMKKINLKRRVEKC